MKTFQELREGISAGKTEAMIPTSKGPFGIQPKVAVKKFEKGKEVKDNPKEDSDAVKAFLAKGGKIKKLPPAKAQGYHGKDDPGKDMHGVMSKPDTSRFKTQKKVKSMEGYYKDQEIRKQDRKAAKSQTNELSTKTLGNYISKASDATKHRGLPTRKVDNRYSGVAQASKKLDKRS